MGGGWGTMSGTGARTPRVVEVMKPYVCPKCFTPSPGPDKRGACPVCGHSTEGSRVLLGCVLAFIALTLLLIIVGLFVSMRHF